MSGAVGAVVAMAAGTAVAVAACGGSGGGGSSSSPSSPSSPSNPTTPSVNVCGILAGTAFLSQGIVNGTECSPASTPVVKLNLYDKTGIAGGCSGTVIAAARC